MVNCTGAWSAALVFLGAGLGALLRWGLGLWWNAPAPGWPWGTLAANLLGGAAVGVLMAALGHAQAWGWTEESIRAWRLFAVTGFLGGLTTFSTFSAEVVAFLLQSRWMEAAAWAMLHLAGN